jgi:DNA-binding transcriptional MocR family regulator
MSQRIPAMANAYEKGISVVTMSKPWGGCGISIGWLACSDLTMVQKLVDIQYFGSACVSRASEIQGRMILAASEAILEDRRNIILKNKELLTDFIENKYCEWFAWRRPNAGAIAFVEFKGPWTSSELGLHLKKASISIKPAYCFIDEVTPELQNYFRVGFGEAKFPLALRALEEFVKTHQSLWKNMQSE